MEKNLETLQLPDYICGMEKVHSQKCTLSYKGLKKMPQNQEKNILRTEMGRTEENIEIVIGSKIDTWKISIYRYY